MGCRLCRSRKACAQDLLAVDRSQIPKWSLSNEIAALIEMKHQGSLLLQRKDLSAAIARLRSISSRIELEQLMMILVEPGNLSTLLNVQSEGQLTRIVQQHDSC